LKIGFLIYGSLDMVTGGYIYDKYLVDYLNSQGDKVEVISQPWRNYPRHLFDNFSKKLQAQLLNLEVDLLIQDELCHPSLFIINQWLKPRVKYPVYSLVHHLRASEVHPSWIQWFYKFVEKEYLSFIDGFIFNSNTTLGVVQEFIPDLPPHVVAYPGGGRLGHPVNKAHIKQRASQKGPLRVVFLGSISPRKQPHVLIQAIAKLPPGMVEVTLVGSMTADSRYSHSVRKMVNDLPVALLDTLNAEELRSLLSQQDILVVPSTYEGFGIVYLEGMGFGLPAIATTQGAACETIRHGDNGYLIEPGDADSLAAYLTDLAMDRSKLTQMSMAALETHKTGPTWLGMGQIVYKFMHQF